MCWSAVIKQQDGPVRKRIKHRCEMPKSLMEVSLQLARPRSFAASLDVSECRGMSRPCREFNPDRAVRSNTD
jgi:hypothetical protein